MTGKEWQEFDKRVGRTEVLDAWPQLLTEFSALESFCTGLKGVNDQQRRTIAAVVAERDGLKAELKERWNLDAKLALMEKDRDEWKGMASRGATTNVEYMALMEAAQDRAERAEKERDVETAVGFALGGQLNDAEATLARLREKARHVTEALNGIEECLQTMVDLVDSAHDDGVMIHVPDRVRVALATPSGDGGLREATCPECGFRYVVWDEDGEVWECGSGVCGHVNAELEPLTVQEIRGE